MLVPSPVNLFGVVHVLRPTYIGTKICIRLSPMSVDDAVSGLISVSGVDLVDNPYSYLCSTLASKHVVHPITCESRQLLSTFGV